MQGKDLSRLLAGTSLIVEYMMKQGQRNSNMLPFQRLSGPSLFGIMDESVLKSARKKVNDKRKAIKDKRNRHFVTKEYEKEPRSRFNIDRHANLATGNLPNKSSDG